MKLGVMSDLHMEFNDWEFKPLEDVFYICAGDIHSNIMKRSDFVWKHREHMFAIKGNHDYYGDSFKYAIGDVEVRNVGDIKIAGAPLWTDLSLGMDWFVYTRNLVDARFIRDLTYDDYMDVHRAHKKFLLESEADVVVSHHCPSFQSVHEKYRGDALNVCFATELANDILNMKKPPKLWVHGHTHEEFDYMIGETRVVCHPRGYPREQSWYSSYKPKIIEV